MHERRRQITPHLPHLRRFARALSGTQESGDSLVVSTLETLIEDDSQFQRELSPKVALYNVFIGVLRASADQSQPTSGSANPAERRLPR